MLQLECDEYEAIMLPGWLKMLKKAMNYRDFLKKRPVKTSSDAYHEAY